MEAARPLLDRFSPRIVSRTVGLCRTLPVTDDTKSIQPGGWRLTYLRVYDECVVRVERCQSLACARARVAPHDGLLTSTVIIETQLPRDDGPLRAASDFARLHVGLSMPAALQHAEVVAAPTREREILGTAQWRPHSRPDGHRESDAHGRTDECRRQKGSASPRMSRIPQGAGTRKSQALAIRWLAVAVPRVDTRTRPRSLTVTRKPEAGAARIW